MKDELRIKCFRIVIDETIFYVRNSKKSLLVTVLPKDLKPNNCEPDVL